MSGFRAVTRTLGLAALLAAAAAGCDTSPPPPDLTGTVTFEGKGVEDGQIYVTPDRSKGNDGKAINATIRDGRYEIRAEDRPMPSGPVVFKIDSLVDGAIYTYETAEELPRGRGTKDFAIKKAESKMIPPLAAPSMPGGGKGKGKGDRKEKKDRAADNKDKAADNKPEDEKSKDEKSKDEKPQEKKDAKS